jgi:hypothetical protein
MREDARLSILIHAPLRRMPLADRSSAPAYSRAISPDWKDGHRPPLQSSGADG